MIIIVFVLLLLAAAGGGAYYYFFMMNKDDIPIAVEEPVMEPIDKPKLVKEAVKPNMDYFVTSNKLNVRSYPRTSATIRYVLRKGKAIKALEVKGEWARISDYQVHQSGNDIADWVHTDFLSHQKPVITPQEKRKGMVQLLSKSDDFMRYEDQFILATQNLIDDELCSYEDFELLDGWVLSRTFNNEPVYFVYCGGTERENKIYLNIESGNTFQP